MSARTMPRDRAVMPVKVEPRLQARRIEVARDQGRRRLRILIVVVVLVLLVVAAVAITQSPLLDVDHVVVRGGTHTQDAQAREAAGIERGAALISVDTASAEAKVEALPWVASATVARSWPDTVTIAIRERTPIAVVGSGAGAVLVDGEGRSLGPAGSQELPIVSGDPVAAGSQLAEIPRSIVAMLAALPADLRPEVASAHAGPAGTTLTLTDGIKVRWGDRSQATAKADALAVLLEQIDRPATVAIDVSVPRAATVTPR